jgi:hypothetical protein
MSSLLQKVRMQRLHVGVLCSSEILIHFTEGSSNLKETGAKSDGCVAFLRNSGCGASENVSIPFYEPFLSAPSKVLYVSWIGGGI